MAKPISPEEASMEKLLMPDAVIETWNRLIAMKFNGDNTVTIVQDEIVPALVAATGVKRQDVFDLGWLDIENLYHEAGWIVEYNKPDYNEKGPRFFTFKKKAK